MKTDKIEQEKQKAIEYAGLVGATNRLPEIIADIEKRHARRQRRNHIIFWIIVFTVVAAIMHSVTAQSRQLSAMAGYKAFELSASYTAENELIYGAAASATSSDVTEKRANNMDQGKIHKFNGDITPAVFGLIGGKFDDLSIIGKIGASYVSQTINGAPTKDAFLALGIAAEYKISDTTGLRGSYDSVAGALIGVTFHFNN